MPDRVEGKSWASSSSREDEDLPMLYGHPTEQRETVSSYTTISPHCATIKARQAVESINGQILAKHTIILTCRV